MRFIKANTHKDIGAMPCPFCGEKEEIYLEEYETKVGARWRILCAGCMARIDRGYDQQACEPLIIWNKRA